MRKPSAHKKIGRGRSAPPRGSGWQSPVPRSGPSLDSTRLLLGRTTSGQAFRHRQMSCASGYSSGLLRGSGTDPFAERNGRERRAHDSRVDSRLAAERRSSSAPERGQPRSSPPRPPGAQSVGIGGRDRTSVVEQGRPSSEVRPCRFQRRERYGARLSVSAMASTSSCEGNS